MNDAMTLQVLRELRKGQRPSKQIAEALNWRPRAAGSRMMSLEQRKLIKRVTVKRASWGADAKYEWVLTDYGRAVIVGQG